MKKIILILLGVILVCFGYTMFPKEKLKSLLVDQEKTYVKNSVDYSKDENWMHLEKNPQHKVDLVYFYPTVVMSNNGKTVSEINDELKASATKAYNRSGSAFSSYTNVYAPFYRQIPMDIAMKCHDADEYLQIMRQSDVKTDVFSALDLYFTKYNNNRPFILSGHSQGSSVLKMVMDEYMKLHPEYLKRMVAAYMIGFPVTQSWLNENPYLKFAEGEKDTGVIVSWNTEGPNATMKNFVLMDGAISINPLNWKRDETPAGVSENKGSLDKDGFVGSGTADATLDLKRGVVVCTTQDNYISGEMIKFFGDKSFHFGDYGLYYVNIKENGQKRIESYLNQNK